MTFGHRLRRKLEIRCTAALRPSSRLRWQPLSAALRSRAQLGCLNQQLWRQSLEYAIESEVPLGPMSGEPPAERSAALIYCCRACVLKHACCRGRQSRMLPELPAGLAAAAAGPAWCHGTARALDCAREAGQLPDLLLHY